MSAASELDAPVILQASAGARKYAGEAFLRKMVEAARKYSRIVQAGTQRRSDGGLIACAAPDGRLELMAGNPDTRLILRSAGKPFQVAALIESGADVLTLRHPETVKQVKAFIGRYDAAANKAGSGHKTGKVRRSSGNGAR